MKRNPANTDKTKKTSISLGNYYQKIITREISSGRYRSVSEVVRAGLLLFEKEEVNILKFKKTKTKGVNKKR